jgi:hypothetical protein
MTGFFNYFQSNVPQLAELCVPLSNLLTKGKPFVLERTMVEVQAFDDLKRHCANVLKQIYIQ